MATAEGGRIRKRIRFPCPCVPLAPHIGSALSTEASARPAGAKRPPPAGRALAGGLWATGTHGDADRMTKAMALVRATFHSVTPMLRARPGPKRAEICATLIVTAPLAPACAAAVQIQLGLSTVASANTVAPWVTRTR